jgi:hypothetical protein
VGVQSIARVALEDGAEDIESLVMDQQSVLPLVLRITME